MPFQEDHYKAVIQVGSQIHANIGKPTNKFSTQNLNKLKQVLTNLGHYDEYYSIMDLRTHAFDWCMGVDNVLGYNSAEWTHRNAIENIHEDFRTLFLDLGLCAYLVFQDGKKLPQGPLSGRYIINVPVRKQNGKYLWLKQMSMPLDVDENGRMVKQFNVFTVLCRFEDVFLPLSPRIFIDNNIRARDLEEDLFKLFLTHGKLKLDPIHLNILKAYCVIDAEQNMEKIERQKGKQRVPILHKEVAAKINQPERVVKKQAAKIHDRFREAYNITFPAIHQVAKFFKPLFYLEIQEMKNKG